jgi:hypothetical protein
MSTLSERGKYPEELERFYDSEVKPFFLSQVTRREKLRVMCGFVLLRFDARAPAPDPEKIDMRLAGIRGLMKRGNHGRMDAIEQPEQGPHAL